jgi:LysM repeat protein
MFPRIIVAVLALALVVGFYARPSGGAGPEHTYVVRPGDTLWSIAVRTHAGDPREGVWELRRRNHLVDSTILPGERLTVP